MVDPGLSVGDKIRLDLEVAVKDAQSLLDLTKSLKDLAKTFRFVKDKGKELAETNKRLKKAQEDFNKVIKRAKGLKSALVQQTKIEVQATKELGSAFKKLRVEEEKAHKLAKAKFNLTRQQISANVALMRATKNIQKVENRRLTTAATQAEVDRKKLRLNAEELAQLGLKATAISREIAAKEQLALQNALLGEKETRNIRAQVLALKAKNAELDKQALRKARAAAGLPATDGVPSADRVKKSRGQVDKLNRSLKTTQSMGNRISFTFRRLFGILAAFTIARKLVQGFVESVKAAIKFNAQLEQSILGMASLIVSAGRIHTALGPAVTEAQNLALATQEARKQIELLRSDALQTAASFEDLIEAFQIAITPGLQAGLGLNEIRELTVRISQAAAAIALPQRQLAEEIRSLLQGTIRVRDTRIAVSLGITNDDIRRAKELGDLGGFLTRRFRAFALAGKQAEQNLSILFTNTKDALLLLAGRAGVDFFDSVKEILTSIKDSVVELNKVTGEIELDPEAMAVADTFFSALESAVREAIKLKDNLSSFQLEQIGSALSSTFSATMTILRVGLEVFIDAISIISVGLNAVFLVIKGIGKIFGIFAQEPAINKAISGLLKLMLALGLAIKITTAAWAIHKIVVKGVKAVYYTTLVGGRALVTMLKFMTLAVVGSTASFKALKVTLAPLLIPIAALLAKITAIALTALVAVSAVRLMLSADVEADAIEKLEELIRLREEELKLIRYAKSDLLDSADAIASQEREFGLLQDRIRRVVADLNKLGVSSEELDLVHAGTDPADVRNFVDRIVKDAKHLLSSLGKEMGDLASGLFGGKVGQSELEKIFENFPQAVSPINRALDQQRDKLKNLGEQLNEHITLSGLIAQNMGLGGEALEHRIAQAKTELDLKKTTLQLEAERTNAEKATDNALESKLNIQRRINKLSKEDQNIVAFGLNSLKVRKGITNQISLLEQKIATQYALKAKEREETERDRIDLVVKGLEEEIKKAEKLAEIERVMGDSFFDKIDDVEQRKFLAEIVEDQLQAEANLNAALSAREEILAAILTITKAIRAEAGAALAKEASTQTQTLKLQTAELELQLRHQKELTQFSTAFTETRVSEKTLVQARQAVELERQKLSVIDATRTIQEAQFLKSLEAAKTDVERNAIIERMVAGQKQFNIELGIQNEKLQQTVNILDDLKFQEDEPIFAGALEAVRQMSADLGTEFTRMTEVVKFGLEGLADAMTGHIVGLFDPTDTMTAKERLGRFLLSMSAMMIQMIIRVAIIQNMLLPWLNAMAANKVLEATATSIGTKIATFGLAHEGGTIKPADHDTKRAFGLRKGGATGRPGNIHPNDTVPIWAEPGEWMMRLSAVKKYGLGIMSSINDGLVDPSALAALSGASNISRNISANTSPSFAKGGMVSDQLALQAALPNESESEMPNVGFVLASDDQMDAMINGGSGALLRWFADNSSVIKGLID